MEANFGIQLQVQTVQGNSSMNFGNHTVHCGISHSSKSNSGFGAVEGNNTLMRNVCVVFDNDLLDALVDDRDVHVYAPHLAGDPHVVNARVDAIQVETLQQNAGVFIGETAITGLDSHEKDNIGVGPFYGLGNVTRQNLVVQLDQDVVDAAMDDRDIKSGVFFTSGAGAVGPVR
ncbi:MAG: hypothetical protein K6T31_06730 [Alicyclobacillus sp.]|nr:hypothetical protein [Alicyclobacillus sp.]